MAHWVDMTHRSRWMKFVLLGLSGLLISFLVISTLNYLADLFPSWEDAGYFPRSSGMTLIDPVKWEITRFRPIFLGSYTKDGGDYIVGGYRKANGAIARANIFVGGKFEGKSFDLLSIKTASNGVYIKPTDFKQLLSFLNSVSNLKLGLSKVRL